MKTNNPIETPWQATHGFLRQLGLPVSKAFCKEQITTHPDYPALTSIMDFLETGSKQFNAVQATQDHLAEMNYPLLAHIQENGSPEHLKTIPSIADWQQADVLKNWSGVAIYPEQNLQWSNAESEAAIRNQRKRVAAFAAIASLAILALAYTTIKTQNLVHGLFMLLSLTGLLISVLQWAMELGYQSETVKQVCGMVSEGGCEKVMKSKYAKGFAGIAPADASLAYFGVQWLLCLLAVLKPIFLQPIYLVTSAGLLVAGWSVYTQAIKLKQWCALCLGIVGVLTLQFVIAIAAIIFNQTLFTFKIGNGMVAYAILLPAAALVIKPIRNFMEQATNNKADAIKLKQWRQDVAVFKALLEKEPQVDDSVWQNDLVLGNPQAALRITVACNPYCGPCAKAHKDLDALLEKHKGDVAVLLRFVFDAKNENDRRAKAAQEIMNTSLRHPNEKVKIINDWFAAMCLHEFGKKWPNTAVEEATLHLMEQNSAWAERADIEFTPTFFVNGHKLPGRYDLQGLALLLPQFVEEKSEIIS